MKIQVTEKHIKSGTRNSAYFCPVALAIIDAAHPDFVSVGVTLCRIGYDRHNPDSAKSFLLDENIGRWIRSFDNGDLMQPTELELPIEAV